MLDLSQQGSSFADRSDPGLGSDASAEEVSLKRPHWKNRHTLGTISGFLCNHGPPGSDCLLGIGTLGAQGGELGLLLYKSGVPLQSYREDCELSSYHGPEHCCPLHHDPVHQRPAHLCC